MGKTRVGSKASPESKVTEGQEHSHRRRPGAIDRTSPGPALGHDGRGPAAISHAEAFDGLDDETGPSDYSEFVPAPPPPIRATNEPRFRSESPERPVGEFESLVTDRVRRSCASRTPLTWDAAAPMVRNEQPRAYQDWLRRGSPGAAEMSDW